jgi:kynurenine formamidase
MCETCAGRAKGWQGWIDVPAPRLSASTSPWLDLSHPVSEAMPCASIFPKPGLRLLREMPKDPFNVTELTMVVHAGTHVDAPRHYFLDGPAFDEIPLDRLHGQGVVWHIDKKLDEIIEVADLERARPRLEPGDILALDTGWSARVGTETYDRHPSLSIEAAHWLVAARIKLLACDFATPDLVYHLRQPGFDWPVHDALLSRGILICEHLTGHAPLAGNRADFIFAGLGIRGCDGAPARVMGRRIDT